MNKTEQSRIAFDRQADTYDSDFHGKHARELYPFMLELMIQLPVRDVLDLGCGTCACWGYCKKSDCGRFGNRS